MNHRVLNRNEGIRIGLMERGFGPRALGVCTVEI